jgi:hypothetical protein
MKTTCMFLCVILLGPQAALFAQEVGPDGRENHPHAVPRVARSAADPSPQRNVRAKSLVHVHRLIRNLRQHAEPPSSSSSRSQSWSPNGSVVDEASAAALLGGMIVFMGEANGCSPTRPGGPCVSAKDVAIGAGVGALVGFVAGAAHER